MDGTSWLRKPKKEPLADLDINGIAQEQLPFDKYNKSHKRDRVYWSDECDVWHKKDIVLDRFLEVQVSDKFDQEVLSLHRASFSNKSEIILFLKGGHQNLPFHINCVVNICVQIITINDG